jgi:hypothetical protein
LTISKPRGETCSHSGADRNKPSSNDHAKGYPIYPIAMLLGGVTLIIVGIWQIAFRQPETLWRALSGAMMEFAGLSLFVAGSILLRLYFIPSPGAAAGPILSGLLPT